MVITAATKDFLLMANDSAVRKDFDNFTEYESGVKRFFKKDVGCVTMWGERCGNNLVRYLNGSNLSHECSVRDLANEVNRYLAEEYRPDEEPLSDTGYHVGGLDRDNRPSIFHIFWNTPTSQNPDAQIGSYSFQHYRPEKPFILHNGRNQLINLVISALNIELKRNSLTKMPFNLPGLCHFAHFCMRFGSEITDDVAPPFQFYVQTPGKEAVTLNFSDAKSVDASYFIDELAKIHLGIPSNMRDLE